MSLFKDGSQKENKSIFPQKRSVDILQCYFIRVTYLTELTAIRNLYIVTASVHQLNVHCFLLKMRKVLIVEFSCIVNYATRERK